jgi:hypothetical protein
VVVLGGLWGVTYFSILRLEDVMGRLFIECHIWSLGLAFTVIVVRGQEQSRTSRYSPTTRKEF